MLTRFSAKSVFFSCFFGLCALQILLALTGELFVDEAFYWLEGQHLAWSYSEVPGWVPWLHAFSEQIFPHHPVGLRTPSLIALFSIPFLGMALNKSLFESHELNWFTGLLSLSLPLLGITGTLAVADIWIVVFTLLAFLFWLKAYHSKRMKWFLLLGITLALGINTHIRFWLIVLIACLVIFWTFKANKIVITSLLKYSLPMMLLGFIPIFIFNFQNDFPLLEFQLKDRHPWQFQISHLNFFWVQILITTPLLFYGCFKVSNQFNKTKQPNHQVIIFTAVIHWLLYAILGFFSDTLRLNIHWPLLSYLLLTIAASPTFINLNQRLTKWAIFSGISTHVAILLIMLYWQNWQQPRSILNAQITANASGWSKLAVYTEGVLNKYGESSLLADNFMTLAQLKYYSSQIDSIKSTLHPLNDKHGRSKQLQIMNLIQATTKDQNILVVEHSALKLTEQIPYYQATCQYLGGLELIDSLDLYKGLKTYHYFKTGTGNCQFSPITYHERNGNNITGWVVEDMANEITLITPKNMQTKITLERSEINPNDLFQSLSPTRYRLVNFTLETNQSKQQPLQLRITQNDVEILSHRLN